MKLLVAEKPSVAKDHYQKMLQRQGEKFTARDGYLEGQNWCISWCVGHLVTLSAMDSYEGYEGQWKLSPLPCLPEKFKLDAIAQSSKQLGILRHLMEKAELLVNGADAGREGNLIFDLVLDLYPALKQKEQRRLWVNSYVEKDLDQAFARLEPMSERLGLSYAARLRQRADWLVGLNATRAYTLTAGRGKLLSVGRVQTPTLNLMVSRDRDVESFREFYVYGLQGHWKQVPFAWCQEDKIAWVEEKPLAERVRQRSAQTEFELSQWKITVKKSFPPKPFDLTDLQKEAHRRLKFSAARTLEIAQELYEKKHISYPRTDSAYITDAMKAEAYELAQKLGTPQHLELMRPLGDKFVFVNDKKVTDHYAILPTANEPSALPKEQMALYQLIRARFLTAWLLPQQWKEGVAVIERGEDRFRSTLRVELNRGWKGLWKEDEDSKKSENAEDSEQEEFSSWLDALPDWRVGDLANLLDLELKEKKKSRPKYFTEATLLTAMKTAGRQIEDEELAEAMKERGLGTPATQASIIETLKSRQFIAEEKGYLVSTALGRMLIDKVDERLKSPELTGGWEYKLRQVEKGELDAKDFATGIKQLVTEVFDGLRRDYSTDFERESQSWDQPCLKCGSAMERQNWGMRCLQADCQWKLPFSVAGRAFSLDELRALCEGQELLGLSGFRSKRGFEFEAGLRMVDGEISLILSEDPERTDHPLSVKCPACKSALVHNSRRVRCTGERCPFVLWKTIASRTLSEEEWAPLLSKKTVGPIQGFKSKAGKDFSASLKLGGDFRVQFVFEEKSAPNTGPNSGAPASPARAAVSGVQCPQCQGPLYRGQRALGCIQSACGWNTPLSQASYVLSDEDFAQILGVGGRSSLIRGFVGKESNFEGVLYLDEQKIVRFDKSSCRVLEPGQEIE